jgi:hypothetical protein
MLTLWEISPIDQAADPWDDAADETHGSYTAPSVSTSPRLMRRNSSTSYIAGHWDCRS